MQLTDNLFLASRLRWWIDRLGLRVGHHLINSIFFFFLLKSKINFEIGCLYVWIFGAPVF